MKKMICTMCGMTGKPKRVSQGSILIEIVLWCCLLVPGILYSLWRMTSKKTVCRHCGSPNMVPLNSPVGRQVHARQQTPAAAG